MEHRRVDFSIFDGDVPCISVCAINATCVRGNRAQKGLHGIGEVGVLSTCSSPPFPLSPEVSQQLWGRMSGFARPAVVASAGFAFCLPWFSRSCIVLSSSTQHVCSRLPN